MVFLAARSGARGVVQEEWYRDVPFTEPRMPCTVYGPEDGIDANAAVDLVCQSRRVRGKYSGL
jgi:hypothetical protein